MWGALVVVLFSGNNELSLSSFLFPASCVGCVCQSLSARSQRTARAAEPGSPPKDTPRTGCHPRDLTCLSTFLLGQIFKENVGSRDDSKMSLSLCACHLGSAVRLMATNGVTPCPHCSVLMGRECVSRKVSIEPSRM